MKHIFILNPTTNRAKQAAVKQTAQTLCETNGFDYLFIESAYPGHARDIAKKYHREDDVCLYAVGGDGTAFEVLNGLNDGVSMAVLPTGSGNDYYTAFGDIREPIINITAKTIVGKTVKVDYGTANGKRFINGTNMGMDADINDDANHYAAMHPIFERAKKAGYIIAALSNLRKQTPFHMTLEMNGQRLSQDVLLCSVMLGKEYGGGFKSTPNASLQDGLFDVCIVRPPKPKIKALSLLPKYYQGKHLDLDVITIVQTKSLIIHTDRLIHMGTDGEIFRSDSQEFACIEAGLSLRVSADSPLK